MNDKIKQLQAEIEREREKMRNCNHDFDKPFYNPETKMEPTGFRQVAQGSDIWTESTGYTEKSIPRWTRKCKICGKEEHTYKEKPIIKGYEPDF